MEKYKADISYYKTLVLSEDEKKRYEFEYEQLTKYLFFVKQIIFTVAFVSFTGGAIVAGYGGQTEDPCGKILNFELIKAGPGMALISVVLLSVGFSVVIFGYSFTTKIWEEVKKLEGKDYLNLERGIYKMRTMLRFGKSMWIVVFGVYIFTITLVILGGLSYGCS